MKRATFLKLATLSLTTLAALLPLAGQAQDAYPNKTIRFVVPYPPGGPTDLMARLLQGELQTRLGVSVIIDNKAGAGWQPGQRRGCQQNARRWLHPAAGRQRPHGGEFHAVSQHAVQPPE